MPLSLRTLLGRVKSTRNSSGRRARLVATVEGLESRELLAYGITTFPLVNVSVGNFATGSDGNIWIANGDSLAVFNPKSPARVVTNYLLPSNEFQPSSLISGPDGNLWFVFDTTSRNSGVGGIASFSPSTHQFTQYPTASGKVNADYPLPILAFDGKGNLWEAAKGSGTLNEFNPSTGGYTQLTVPSQYSIQGLTQGPGGSIWFAEGGVGYGLRASGLGSIDPKTNQIIEHPLTGDPVVSITLGPDGNLWYVQTSGDTSKPSTVGVFNPTSNAVVANYPLQAPAGSISRGMGIR